MQVSDRDKKKQLYLQPQKQRRKRSKDVLRGGAVGSSLGSYPPRRTSVE